jgi:ubiquinone/menaquinone biosynthesis C-methylase UbiE
MSCGSGLFARRFVKSGRFKGVIAADYSEAMLGQAKQFFDQNTALDPR